MSQRLSVNPLVNLESRISNLESYNLHRIVCSAGSPLDGRDRLNCSDDDPLLEINVLVGSNILAILPEAPLRSNGTGYGERPLPHLPGSRKPVVRAHPAKCRKSAGSRTWGIRSFWRTFWRRIRLRFTRRSPVSRDSGMRCSILSEIFAMPELLRTKCWMPSRPIPAMKDRRQHLCGSGGSVSQVSGDASASFMMWMTISAPPSAMRRSRKRRSGPRQLLVYGIYDATGQQSQLLAALKNVFEMIYFIPYVDESISANLRSRSCKPAFGSLASNASDFRKSSRSAAWIIWRPAVSD